ncbi:MAG: NUDIX hydrolase [Verrucomicrobia bacterium]|nr:NUDIX hydrolase [Verrucomicrobiota bacterium]
MIRPWPTSRTEPLGDFRIFKVRRDLKRSPRTDAEHDFFVLECPGWVNVIALTPDDQLVLVEQFRHGVNTVELEIPGGVMDAEDRDPVATAVRELREHKENPQIHLCESVKSVSTPLRPFAAKFRPFSAFHAG